jgi:hypothetical protein
MTDAEIKADLDELHVVALTLWGEARGEPVEGRIFVGSVIRNRVQTPRRFGDTYDKVCLARAQFSCWLRAGGPENYAAVMARARLFAGDYAERPSGLLDADLQEMIFLAEGIIGGQLKDNARGANHYCTSRMFSANPPDWAKGKRPIVEVGAHVGFKI